MNKLIHVVRMLRDVNFFLEVTGVVPDSLSAGGCWREGGGNYISYREVYSPCNPHVADR